MDNLVVCIGFKRGFAHQLNIVGIFYFGKLNVANIRHRKNQDG
jgi:hypothetical protein